MSAVEGVDSMQVHLQQVVVFNEHVSACQVKPLKQ
jgi:hypothetical protein